MSVLITLICMPHTAICRVSFHQVCLPSSASLLSHCQSEYSPRLVGEASHQMAVAAVLLPEQLLSVAASKTEVVCTDFI